MRNIEAIYNESLEGKYLIFRLIEGVYGINIKDVIQKMSYSDITKIDISDSPIVGITNTQGTYVPVLDLRKMYGLDEVSCYDDSNVLIVGLSGDYSDILIGIVVDKVLGINMLSSNKIVRLNKYDNKIDSRFFSGVAVVRNSITKLLNISRIMNEIRLSQREEQ